MKQARFAVLAAFGLCASAQAQDASESAAQTPFAVSKSAQLLTGDTWRDGDHLFRLYGVQSCLRGTSAEQPNGNKIDCGNTSLAHLAALFDSAAVTCQPIGYALDKAVFVVCGAQLNGEASSSDGSEEEAAQGRFLQYFGFSKCGATIKVQVDDLTVGSYGDVNGPVPFQTKTHADYAGTNEDRESSVTSCTRRSSRTISNRCSVARKRSVVHNYLSSHSIPYRFKFIESLNHYHFSCYSIFRSTNAISQPEHREALLDRSGHLQTFCAAYPVWNHHLFNAHIVQPVFFHF